KFWCKGYFVDTVGRNKKTIQEYIQQQMQEDMVEDQLTLFEEYDPFTGKKNKNKPLW
ncbi:MAG: transposase, partial [Acidaminococcaceae bacterium]|nr:transposase [Acidaminococcaceae bacterium]